jgi:uncharacterized membrane protein YtjA (UPF0391 family)
LAFGTARISADATELEIDVMCGPQAEKHDVAAANPIQQAPMIKSRSAERDPACQASRYRFGRHRFRSQRIVDHDHRHGYQCRPASEYRRPSARCPQHFLPGDIGTGPTAGDLREQSGTSSIARSKSSGIARAEHHRRENRRNGRMTLLKWALIFFLVSIVAGILGFTGISAASADVARFLFYVFVVIFLVLLILGLTIFRV